MWNPLRITLLVDHQADDPALASAAPERLRFTVQALQRMGIPIIRPVHCSGTEEVAHLHAHLGDRVRPLAAGESLVLEETATVG